MALLRSKLSDKRGHTLVHFGKVMCMPSSLFAVVNNLYAGADRSRIAPSQLYIRQSGVRPTFHRIARQRAFCCSPARQGKYSRAIAFPPFDVIRRFAPTFRSFSFLPAFFFFAILAFLAIHLSLFFPSLASFFFYRVVRIPPDHQRQSIRWTAGPLSIID